MHGEDEMKTLKPLYGCLSLLLLSMVPPGSASGAGANVSDGEPRTSRTSYFARDGREQQVPDKISQDEVRTGGDAAAKGRRSERRKSSNQWSKTPNTDFWFYDVDVELFADEDLDGYLYGIDLLFDADTIYERADVYAVMYLSREGGPWYEYAATDVFPVFGATSEDDFVVVSELLTGYPAGSYDLLIELYDTWDDAFVAEIGPENSAELSYLPLEDAERDEPFDPPDVIVVEEGGGSGDLLTLLAGGLFLGAAAVRHRRLSMRPAHAPPRPGRYG